MGISWLYVYYVVFGYVPTMGLSQSVYVFCSFRTAVLDCALLWYSQLCILCILVFAPRCWTVPYYGTVSCVYYVFLDIPLIWACQLLCMVLSDHTNVSNIFILI